MSLHQTRLIFCCCAVSPHIPYALRCLCVYWSYFLLHMQHWNRFYSKYIKQNFHLSEIFEWIVEFHTISLFLWRSWLWIVHHLCFNVLVFFMVQVLLGNNRKIEFKGGFLLGEMTSDFAAKSRRNSFATKLYLVFTLITLTRLLKTLSKLRLLLLKTENKVNELSSF